MQQVADRKYNLTADYEAICAVVPELRDIASVQDFWWARMMVASRNFGVMIDGQRTDVLVPYADMLNHYRPRQTRWAFDNHLQSFTMHSLVKLQAGQQVYDSYGKKCNSRFLLNYGFTVEHNADDDIGQNHNEVRWSPCRCLCLLRARALFTVHALCLVRGTVQVYTWLEYRPDPAADTLLSHKLAILGGEHGLYVFRLHFHT